MRNQSCTRNADELEAGKVKCATFLNLGRILCKDPQLVHILCKARVRIRYGEVF